MAAGWAESRGVQNATDRRPTARPTSPRRERGEFCRDATPSSACLHELGGGRRVLNRGAGSLVPTGAQERYHIPRNVLPNKKFWAVQRTSGRKTCSPIGTLPRASTRMHASLGAWASLVVAVPRAYRRPSSSPVDERRPLLPAPFVWWTLAPRPAARRVKRGPGPSRGERPAWPPWLPAPTWGPVPLPAALSPRRGRPLWCP